MSDDPDDRRPTDTDALIDENLERVFEALLQEEMPERFLHVIRMLEARDPSDSDEGDAS